MFMGVSVPLPPPMSKGIVVDIPRIPSKLTKIRKLGKSTHVKRMLWNCGSSISHITLLEGTAKSQGLMMPPMDVGSSRGPRITAMATPLALQCRTVAQRLRRGHTVCGTAWDEDTEEAAQHVARYAAWSKGHPSAAVGMEKASKMLKKAWKIGVFHGFPMVFLWFS